MPAVTLHFSEPMVRRVAKAFWWRTIGPLYLVMLVLFAISLGVAIWQGDRSWWVGAIGSAFLISVAMTIAVYVIHFRGSMARFRRMRVPEGILDLGEDRLKLGSDAGASELPWSSITEVWRFPEFWLVFISRAQFFTVPTADLDAETREFFLAKVKAHGIKIA